ncbi:MAG: hypothetical protein ACFFCP_15360 [Promethearchaeota archaeon]
MKSTGIPVIVSESSSESEMEGILYFNEEGPFIELLNRETLKQESDTTFRITSSENKNRIELKPIIIRRMKYSIDPVGSEPMYPPSTDGWLSNVVESGVDSMFIIQQAENNKKQLLSIVSLSDLTLLKSIYIQPYETQYFNMVRDYYVYNQLYYRERDESDIFTLLNEKAPSWDKISGLIDGAEIANVERKETMELTMAQLVPTSFPLETRKQIMAFLAWLGEAKIPDEDPADFSMRYANAGVFRALVTGHLKCMLDNVESPPYVQILFQAEKGHFRLTHRPRPEQFEQNPLVSTWLKLYEIFPDWMDRVIRFASSLNSSGKIITGLPVTREDARKSRAAWSDRFAMATQGLMMRGHIHKDSLNLVPVVYTGGAHRWPHKHLEWSARLGYDSLKQRHIQVMVMPISGYERASRVIPTLMRVDWETSTLNLSLYSLASHKWTMKSTLIERAIGGSRSLRQMEHEFHGKRSRTIVTPDDAQVKVLDMISWGIFLRSLESGQYSEFYKLDIETITNVLSDLQNRGVFLLQYSLVMQKLVSVCFLIKGPAKQVISLSRAFLKYAPSAQVRITEKGKSCSIVARIPEDAVNLFISQITLEAREQGISISAYPISAYVGYRNNLYSRLLRSDGTWDDDVSGLLNQVRLWRDFEY